MLRHRLAVPVTGSARAARLAAFALTAALILLAGQAGIASAKSITCQITSECVGTKHNDTIRGKGVNVLKGKGGNDTITSGGNSVIEGGKGNDSIRAGDGKGNNVLRGGKGNDTIHAANGQPDSIDCGEGRDTAYFDKGLDSVANCEKKHRG